MRRRAPLLPAGEHGRGRQKQSEYRLQLREKQKARRYYGVLEKQFHGYYEKASRQPGITGENLLALLECRLDNVLVRLGFAASRRQARQLIRHGHWTVNGRRVNIPSYQVRPGEVIAIKAGTPATQVVRDATELTGQIPAWLQADHESLTAKVLRKPELIRAHAKRAAGYPSHVWRHRLFRTLHRRDKRTVTQEVLVSFRAS